MNRFGVAFASVVLADVGPVVPYLFTNTVNVLGKRVECYSFDAFAEEVALDRLCLTP